MKTQFKCPACHKPLSVDKMEDLMFPVVYCSEGPCTNVAAETGKPVVTTEESAYTELVKAVEAEIEAKPECSG